ncbi:MAG TPA: type I restriction enzyme HsdR N-terminal domain-containing protein [bacterium]|nr:MAG: hypothetical protein UX37_C0022G0005 [Microgenomates group bacterium GW2011_GWA2_46_16]
MSIDITKDLKKYIPIFQQAQEQNINEAETSLRIGKFLEDVLGYDVFHDITKEHTIKDRYVDYAIKADGKVMFFIEIKQAGIELKEKHIEQASNYAANAGVEWVLLTNGIAWQMYHLTFDEGIQSDLIISTNILADDASDKLSLFHKKSILKGEHEDYYSKIKALSPRSIVQSIFHENTLRMMRTHLKKMSGVTIEEQDLIAGIKGMISSQTWESIGDVKIKRKRKASRHNAPEQPVTEPPASEPSPSKVSPT